jgi:hypothetical protein
MLPPCCLMPPRPVDHKIRGSLKDPWHSLIDSYGLRLRPSRIWGLTGAVTSPNMMSLWTSPQSTLRRPKSAWAPWRPWRGLLV